MLALEPFCRRSLNSGVVVLALLLLLLLLFVDQTNALQNLIPGGSKNKFPAAVVFGVVNNQKARQTEDALLTAIQDSNNGRLFNSDRITELISELEERTSSIPEPAISPTIYGRWRLLYTTNADTSSPIQRKAVDTERFPIYQDIVVDKKKESGDDDVLKVNQVVEFSDSAILSVDAVASTAAYPLPEFTERKSTGQVLGLNVLGVSLVGDSAEPNPDKPNSRIDFVFDEGNFEINRQFKIPYPVPFRLPILRDWVKGWIDITYMSDRLRISRGNKGTTFVLVKEEAED